MCGYCSVSSFDVGQCIECYHPTTLAINFSTEIHPEFLEKLEDKLAEFLAKEGWEGKIEDSTTGNTTIFGEYA